MTPVQANVNSGAAAEVGRGGDSPPNIPVGGPRPPNKIGAMTTECVLLLHALDAFQNALYTTTRIYTRADYSSSSPSLYCKLRNACGYVLASPSSGRAWLREAICGIHNLAPPTPNCCRRLCNCLLL